MKRQAIIPKGAILSVTTGCYSDFIVNGVFRAKENIDCDMIAKKYRETIPQEKYDDTDKFLAMVMTLGLLEPVDTHTWHLGDYHGIEEMSLEFPDGEYIDMSERR